MSQLKKKERKGISSTSRWACSWLRREEKPTSDGAILGDTQKKSGQHRGSSLLTSVDKETGNRGRDGGLQHFEQVKSEGLTGSPMRRGLVLREKIWAGKFNQSTYTYPVKVSVTQSCPTLCNPMDCSPPGSSGRGILQARILEWVVIPFSRGIFPTQGSNLGLPCCRHVLYHLSHREDTLSYEHGRNNPGNI